MSDDDFLSRWSRRKKADRRGEPEAPSAPPQPAAPRAAASEAQPVQEPASRPPLPPVESLTPESDFTPFMRQEVDPGLKRQALKALFQDPRFNVMDGLDVYIDDYSKPDPLPEGWLEKLNQTARLGAYRDPEEKEPQPEGEGAPPETAVESSEDEKPQLEQPLDEGNGEPSKDVDAGETAPERPAES